MGMGTLQDDGSLLFGEGGFMTHVLNFWVGELKLCSNTKKNILKLNKKRAISAEQIFVSDVNLESGCDHRVIHDIRPND